MIEQQNAQARNSEELLKLKDQEIELLVEEIANTKRDSDEKQAQMDALVAETSELLKIEGEKMTTMEQELSRLRIENERLKKELQTRPTGMPLTPRSVNNGPSVELSSKTVAEYIAHSLGDDSSAHFQGGNQDAFSNGIVLSKLINRAVSGTIDERVLNMSPSTPEEIIENINLAITSAKAIGCKVDVTAIDIINGDVSIIISSNLTSVRKPRS
jgi:hypothetical protein